MMLMIRARIPSLLALFSSKVFLQELLRTALAWASLFAIGIWMVICQQWSDMRWLKRLEETEHQLHTTNTTAATTAATIPWPQYSMLQDQFLESLPLLEKVWISDKLVGSSVIIVMVGGSICISGWRNKLMLLRRIAWMVGALYLIRSLTISVTTIPPSIDTCEISIPKSTWEVIKNIPDILAGTIGQCTDKIFSGHTAILMISHLFWRRYATHWCLLVYSFIHTFVGILSVLLARYHYTIDVVIGALLTFFIHHLYYSSLEQAIKQAARAKRFNGNLHYAKSFLSADELDQRIIDDERSNNRIRRRFINDDGMMDYDSAVGVDDTIPMAQYNSNAQSSATQTPCEDNGAQVFSFRKRESSNTAFGRADTVDATGQLGVPIRQTSSTPPPQAQHEITIAGEEDDRTYFFPLQRQHQKAANSQLDDVDANWDLLGINRPFGSILPALVAWMDGLDLRSPPL